MGYDMVDDELRTEIRRLMQEARADPEREIEVVEQFANWCFCAAMVVQFAEHDTVLPAELRPAVRDMAERIIRA